MTKHDIRGWARRYVGEHPLLFFHFYKLRSRHRNLLVDRTTQLVIEGFPRSANTFAVVAFEQAQRKSVRVAHHLHMPAQVMQAARWRIPTLVLIRKPTDAVVSLVIRDPRVSICQALKQYISFYEKVIGYRDAFVVGFFEEVTQDYGVVLERVNAKFGTRFTPFDHSKDNVNDVFGRIEERHRARRNSRLDEKQIARPSAVKAGLKDALNKELEASEIKKLTVRAEAIYEDFVSTAGFVTADPRSRTRNGQTSSYSIDHND
jgi:hypothetical protein